MSIELIQIFVQESDELFTALEEALVRLEGRPDDDEIIQRILSTVHNFKGNASTVGFALLEELAHAFEDFLVPLREGTRATPAVISLALEALDALRRLVPAAVAGAGALGPADRKLLERLASRDLRGGKTAATPSLTTRNSVAPPATLRVSLATLDRMLTLTGELLVARGRLGASLARSSAAGAAETLEETDRLFADLQDLVMRARMVSIGPVLRQFLRAVRDAALVLGKRVRVEIEGEDVEIDAALVERLRDPLVHLVRNALDHGIESPEVRAARGKDPCGTLRLRAYHQGGSVVVEVKDDGGGMSRTAIARRVEELGLAREADRLPDHELFEFVFRPGFS
ncbi:MAG TPA: Hpt domain-containing protein, partial [Kofleriaceae bacterium]|nr:Hpt domain-containing protein [Kofleriaceae bacterium]